MPSPAKQPRVHHKHLIMIAVIVIVVLGAAVLAVWLVAPDVIEGVGSSFTILLAPSFSLPSTEGLTPSSNPFSGAEGSPFKIENPFKYRSPFE